MAGLLNGVPVLGTFTFGIDLEEFEKPIPVLARQLRFQYAGALYHVMARGDGGKQIFIRKEDHEPFLYWLERVCENHGWRVHAWMLIRNQNQHPSGVGGHRDQCFPLHGAGHETVLSGGVNIHRGRPRIDLDGSVV